MDNIRNLWHRLTVPKSTDANEMRREYATKVVLTIISIITAISSIVLVIGVVRGNFPPRVSILGVGLCLFFIGGWWLADRGHWRISGYFPPLAVFLIALQNNYLYGIGAPAMLFYVVAIILTTILSGSRAQWILVILSVAGYLVIGWAHVQHYFPPVPAPETVFLFWAVVVVASFLTVGLLQWFSNSQFRRALTQARTYAVELEEHKTKLEQRVAERTAELQTSIAEREQLQQQVIEAQQQVIQELSTPIIPVMDRIIVMPLIGVIDTMRARDITRALLAGISEHRAKVVIVDITGVPVVDSGIAAHLDKTIQAARLKGTRTIITGISDAVAEAIVDLGIDWSGIDTMRDLQTGLIVALNSMGVKLARN